MLCIIFNLYHSLQNFPKINSKNIFSSLHHRGGQFPTNSPSFALIQGQIEPNSPRIRVYTGAHRKQAMCVETQVSPARFIESFLCVCCVWREVGYERAETRSNQIHFTIEFQAGEEESDSHLRGKREKKIWERETRGVSRSAATVSVCLMLIERCTGCCCTPQLLRPLRASRYYGFCASNTSSFEIILYFAEKRVYNTIRSDFFFFFAFEIKNLNESKSRIELFSIR